MPKIPKKGVKICIVLLVVLAICSAAATSDRENLTKPEVWLRDMLAPLKSGTMFVYNKMRVLPDLFGGFNTLREEKLSLEQEVVKLQNQVLNLNEQRLENSRLHELLNLQEEYVSWDPVAASVIARSPYSWYNTITIKGGTNKGFKPNMPVINSKGLVGRIIAVSEYTSEVMLITNKDGAVGAMTQVSRVIGVVEGVQTDSSILQMIHIPYGSEMKVNQVVMTSGYGDIYPHGLRIGYIKEIVIDPGGLMQHAMITPFVDFDRLEEVLVLSTTPANIIDNGNISNSEMGGQATAKE